jgi:hypothetical protein
MDRITFCFTKNYGKVCGYVCVVCVDVCVCVCFNAFCCVSFTKFIGFSSRTHHHHDHHDHRRHHTTTTIIRRPPSTVHCSPPTAHCPPVPFLPFLPQVMNKSSGSLFYAGGGRRCLKEEPIDRTNMERYSGYVRNRVLRYSGYVRNWVLRVGHRIVK